MKKILLPTDFSAAAANALRFARAFLPSDVTIKTLHAYRPEIDPTYAYVGTASENFYNQRTQMLEEFVKASIPPTDDILVATEIEKEVTIGFPTDAIVAASKDDIDLIIMGGTGETDLLNSMFGSVSSHVAQNAHCPVLIIPKDCDFSTFGNILYASDYTSVRPQLVQKAVEFSKPFDATMHFIHVEKSEETTHRKQTLEDTLFQLLFGQDEPKFKLNMASVQANSVVEGLKKYIAENEIDLAILVTHHRNFWERLFHKSVTKQMAFGAPIPMLVLHDDNFL